MTKLVVLGTLALVLIGVLGLLVVAPFIEMGANRPLPRRRRNDS